MTARTKIDVHVGTLSIEFGDTLVQFNIFKAMKHPTEDHSLFDINLIDELVEECLQLDNNGEDISDFAGDTVSFDCLGSIIEEVDYNELQEVHNLSDSEDNNIGLADLSQESKLLELLDQVCEHEDPECSNNVEAQSDPKIINDNSSSLPPPIELKPLPSHLKYAYLDIEQQNLEKENKLLRVLRRHKKAIGWKLSDLLDINPSICMHRILMEEEVGP
ncbi:hypothetical protein CR513_10126, partial [Mucuna pruriens]